MKIDKFLIALFIIALPVFNSAFAEGTIHYSVVEKEWYSDIYYRSTGWKVLVKDRTEISYNDRILLTELSNQSLPKKLSKMVIETQGKLKNSAESGVYSEVMCYGIPKEGGIREKVLEKWVEVSMGSSVDCDNADYMKITFLDPVKLAVSHWNRYFHNSTNSGNDKKFLFCNSYETLNLIQVYDIDTHSYDIYGLCE